jgi:hypothetical protein
MAEIKKVEVTGEELARRIQVQLEFSVRDAEEMLNKELVKGIAAQVGKDWLKLNKKKVLAGLKAEDIAKLVIRAIVQKAVFNLAVEMAEND